MNYEDSCAKFLPVVTLLFGSGALVRKRIKEYHLKTMPYDAVQVFMLKCNKQIEETRRVEIVFKK